eukprot:1160493-Pelagomonas_calceolata.AAC.2
MAVVVKGMAVQLARMRAAPRTGAWVWLWAVPRRAEGRGWRTTCSGGCRGSGAGGCCSAARRMQGITHLRMGHTRTHAHST